jgi:hypothetical protein
MKIVPVVEMQTRLSELLSPPSNEVIQVTYQGTAVVAVLPLDVYHAFREQVVAHQSDTPTPFTITKTSLTETQQLFHSYSNRLAPRLQRNQESLNIIEVMRRKQLVGAILAWDDWSSLAGQSEQESATPGRTDQTLTIVAARNHLLKLADQFADEERRGIFAPVTVTRQGTPVMAIVPWGWFQRVTHFLRKQTLSFLRMESDGLLTISSNEGVSQEGGEHDVVPEHIREVALLGSRFHHAVSTIAVQLPSLTDPNLRMNPSFDHACAELEDQCVSVQQLAQELLAILQVLPLHTAIMKQYSSLPDGIDQQALWEVEVLARATYEHAMAAGASKKVAWDTTRQTCLARVLQRSWGRGQFRLSRDIERLVENVLMQVEDMMVRRRIGMSGMGDEKRQ